MRWWRALCDYFSAARHTPARLAENTAAASVNAELLRRVVAVVDSYDSQALSEKMELKRLAQSIEALEVAIKSLIVQSSMQPVDHQINQQIAKQQAFLASIK